MLNYEFTFGQGLAQMAMQMGTSTTAAAYAVWPVVLLGGLVSNVGYSVYLCRRIRTGSFAKGGFDVEWGHAVAALIAGVPRRHFRGRCRSSWQHWRQCYRFHATADDFAIE
jgi:hypothetical protein